MVDHFAHVRKKIGLFGEENIRFLTALDPIKRLKSKNRDCSLLAHLHLSIQYKYLVSWLYRRWIERGTAKNYACQTSYRNRISLCLEMFDQCGVLYNTKRAVLPCRGRHYKIEILDLFLDRKEHFDTIFFHYLHWILKMLNWASLLVVG